MALTNMKLKFASVFVVIFAILLVSIVSVNVNAISNMPLTISFSDSPPESISQYQIYRVNVIWTNINPKESYGGCFLFIVKSGNSNIDSADITLTYNGFIIQPQVFGNSLKYFLPEETFAPSRSGATSVDVRYNKQGAYQWEIGIIKN